MSINPSIKRHKLGIARPPIRPDIIAREPVLHVDAPRLVKRHLLAAHDPPDLALGPLVQPAAHIAVGYVGRDVELRRAQAGFQVAGEAGGEAVIAGDGGEPARAGEVEGFSQLLAVDEGGKVGRRTGAADQDGYGEGVEDVVGHDGGIASEEVGQNRIGRSEL